MFLVVERIWPAQRRSLFARGYRHDVLYTVLNATLIVPLGTGLTLSFVEVVRTSLPWIVLPHDRHGAALGAIAVIVVAMDACNWFVHLANHRVLMLWRFHELHHSQEDMSVLTVFRTHPLIHVSYLVALLPGVVLLANGAMSTTILVVYGAMRRVRTLEHPPGVRTARPHLRQPELPPHPPPARRSAGREPRLRAHDLGSALRPGGVPDRSHDPDRHRAARSAARRRAGGPAPTSSLGLRRAVGRAVPSDERAHGSPPARSAAPRPGAAPANPIVQPQRESMVTDDGSRASVSRPCTPGGAVQHRTAPLPADCALIAARVVLAWIFVYHGSRRLFGWFDGPGIHDSGAVLREDRPPPPG